MASIKVKYGELTKALQVKSVKEGTTIEGFCEANKIAYNSNIRVNGETVKAEYALKPNDIVTSIASVTGG